MGVAGVGPLARTLSKLDGLDLPQICGAGPRDKSAEGRSLSDISAGLADYGI
jgi:hypothetical protein